MDMEDRGTVRRLMLDPIRQQDQYIRRYMATLPKDPDALVRHARGILEAYDAACRAGDDHDAVVLQSLHYDAVIQCLNEGTRSGCWEKVKWLAHELEAPDGCVPGWGQKGRFIVRTNDMRFLVEYFGIEGVEGMSSHQFTVEAVDVLRPFISETGYRAFYGCSWRDGLSVDQAVVRRINEYMVSKDYTLGRKAERRIFLTERDRQQRLKEQAKDPAFGPEGWIKVARVPIAEPLPPPVQHKLSLGLPPAPEPAAPKRKRTRRN